MEDEIKIPVFKSAGFYLDFNRCPYYNEIKEFLCCCGENDMEQKKTLQEVTLKNSLRGTVEFSIFFKIPV